MAKSLGQVAYEAWFEGLVPEATWEQARASSESIWRQVGSPEIHAWQAAAEAVASEHERRALAPGVQVQLEGKVIEAAKAVVADLFPYGDERWDALIRAVEALEEVKGG